MAEERRLKFWGWGLEGEVPSAAETRALLAHIAARTGIQPAARGLAPPTIEEIEMPAPRLTVPDSLAPLCTTEPYERALHSYGKSYPDYVRAFRREYPNPPDLVGYPESEADVVALLDWADGVGAAVIPFGCGSSVVGGIEPAVGDGFAGTLTIDMRRMDKVLEIDPAARAARIQAGALGPGLEAQLKPAGYSLRHFPQSFAYSTLGGWIATRSGGHFATLYTHIDDFVESLRVVSPAGTAASRRLPSSGAGPSPDRLYIGSEGALGLITEAWMRIQDRPTHRASAAVRFADFPAAAEAVRTISQAGLYPANCRIIDAEETALAKAGDGSFSLLVLGFESADHPVEAWLARALECVADHGGVVDEGAGGHTQGAASAWREAFITAPFARGALVAHDIMHDTFETAITWDRFAAFHATVSDAARRAIREVTGCEGHVSCRFTHAYPDGPAPYFTFHAAARRGAEIEQWRAIKRAVSDALIAAGGTITHHHAVGRDHMEWYLVQRPAPFGAALAAAKAALDPNGILNPGVLVPARGSGPAQAGMR